MKWAVNITDMSKDVLLSLLLFGPEINGPKVIVQAEKYVLDGKALLLSTTDRRAIDRLSLIIRKLYGPNKYRLYESKTGNGGWKRI